MLAVWFVVLLDTARLYCEITMVACMDCLSWLCLNVNVIYSWWRSCRVDIRDLLRCRGGIDQEASVLKGC